VTVVSDNTAAEPLRLQAIRVLGRDTEHATENLERRMLSSLQIMDFKRFFRAETS